MLRWLFEDRCDGQIVVAQMPNAPMWLALAALGLRYILPAGRAEAAASIAFGLAITVWSLGELLRGVNFWRRILGAGTLVASVGWLLLHR